MSYKDAVTEFAGKFVPGTVSTVEFMFQERGGYCHTCWTDERLDMWVSYQDGDRETFKVVSLSEMGYDLTRLLNELL